MIDSICCRLAATGSERPELRHQIEALKVFEVVERSGRTSVPVQRVEVDLTLTREQHVEAIVRMQEVLEARRQAALKPREEDHSDGAD